MQKRRATPWSICTTKQAPRPNGAKFTPVASSTKQRWILSRFFSIPTSLIPPRWGWRLHDAHQYQGVALR